MWTLRRKGEYAIKIIKFLLRNEIINKRAAGIIRKWLICYICKEKFENKYVKDKKYGKVRDHCHYRGGYRGAALSIRNLKYSIPKKFLQFFIMDLTMIIILS